MVDSKTKKNIIGGATVWARKTIDSEVFYNKPDKWFKIWFYLVNRVNHEDTEKYSRGETFLQTEWICEKTGATKDQVKKALAFFRIKSMIITKRSTRGIWLNIINYKHYQKLDNYNYNKKSTRKAPEKHQRSTREAPRYNKNDKNDKNDKKISKKKTFLQGKEWNELIDLFKPINPMFEDFYKNKTERRDLDHLAKKLTFIKLKALLEHLPEITKKPFSPKITKPTELRRDFGKLKIYFEQEKNKKHSKGKQIIF